MIYVHPTPAMNVALSTLSLTGWAVAESLAERALHSQSTYFTVRGQSYFSRLSKYWPPSPSPPGECVPPPLLRGEDRLAGRSSIFWKTREIGLPSYSKICTLCLHSYSPLSARLADRSLMSRWPGPSSDSRQSSWFTIKRQWRVFLLYCSCKVVYYVLQSQID